jgi:hypothetical protein
MPPDLKALMAHAITPDSSDEACRALGRRWQAWVKSILIDHRDDPLLVEVKECEADESTR